jgi:branched-chain amino acid transport system permease protein
MLEILLQVTLSGLAVGSAYALIAIGFSVTYATTRTLSFGQGDFVSFGGFVALAVLLTSLGLPLTSYSFGGIAPAIVWQFVAFVASIAIIALMGWLLFFVAVRPFAGRPGMAWVMSTLGFGLILEALIIAIWGPKAVSVPSPFGDNVIRFAGVGILPQEAATLCIASLVMLVFDWIMRKSMTGKAMRAVALKPEVASLMGVNTVSMMTGAYVVGSALAGLAGFLLAPILQVSVIMGAAVGLKGFAAAIVGGLSNARGCVFGGFLLGLMEAYLNLFSAQWREVAILLLVIVVLAIRPNGLFEKVRWEKV